MARIALVFGGRSVEHEVSVTSARTVAKGLAAAGHDVVPLGIAPDGGWVTPAIGVRALAGELAALPSIGGPVAPTLRHLLDAGVDAVFPIVHGTGGEDGTLQGLLEMLDLPYVGCGVAASAAAMDKGMTKRLLAARGVPVVESEELRASDLAASDDALAARALRWPFPLFVKPTVGGSSVGVVKVSRSEELRSALEHALRFAESALVERGIRGREIECAVLGDDPIEASVLGEVVPGREFYDYADKYLEDGARLLAPADLPPALADHLRRLAVEAFAAIGGVGMARVDFLLEEDGTAYVNEINTHPGFTSISMYPRLWDLSGVPLPRLVGRLVEVAIRRHGSKRRLDAGIREWIAELASRRVRVASEGRSVP